jgi:transcriptional regulator with XRE-family HTH domain
MNTLGTRIKSLRENKNLTQQQLGEIVELHGSNIGRIEKGKVYPTSDILLKISQYFNVSCDWLLLGENANSQILAFDKEHNFIEIFRQLPTVAQNEVLNYMEYLFIKYKGNAKNFQRSSLSETKNQSSNVS